MVSAKNKRGITKWSNRDEAFVDIAKGIREAIKVIETEWIKEAIQEIQPTARPPLTNILYVWKDPILMR